jgi:DNA repair protein RecO (recombination protein O)
MEGIVLRRIDYGESDQIIKIFLKETGSISVIAKGVKRSKKRFPHRLEPFRVYDFNLSRKKPGKAMPLIQTADQIHDFDGITTDIRKIVLGNFILEIVLIAVREGHPHPELYSFILKTFHALNDAEEVFPLWFYVEIHMMRLLGFSPNFETCIKCKTPLRKLENNYFQPARGGILCPRCGLHFKASQLPVSSETLGILQFLKKASIQAIPRVKISPRASKEIETHLAAFVTYHLERPLRTLPFLRELMLDKP